MGKSKNKSRKKSNRKTGLPPGSLVFTGHKIHESANVVLLQYNSEDVVEKVVSDLVPPAKEGPYLNWYDVRGLSNLKLIESFGETFQIHPLILEDIVDTHGRPKFEEYENGLFLILENFSWDEEKMEISKEQVSIFFRQNLVLSFQEDKDDLFPAVRERIQKASGKIRRRGADYLAYALVDYIVDRYYLVLDEVKDHIEEIEAEIIENPKPEVRNKIHKLRVSTIELRRSAAWLREALSQFSRCDDPILDEGTVLFIRDLLDHITQIVETMESSRDLLHSLYDIYLSELSYRMNNVMKVLTIIATLFIPLTFLVGVYGMNFRYMPELEWRYSYLALWILMIAMVLIMLRFFRRQGWL